MIELKNISKTFGKNKNTFKALNNVSLTVEEGDIVGIIGFSGAGKSTLIRTVNLLERPDQGQILINGTDYTKLKPAELSRQRKKIGMIFQHFNLLSSRTVFGNVALPLELDHKSPSEIKEKVNGLLKIVGLEDKANEYPKNLSGGQKQRVAIARALANDPYLLLCDEATSALDPATTQSILSLLQDINRRLKITVLLITHEMEVIKSICNHVAVIDKGNLVAKGTLEEIFSQRNHPVIRQFLSTENHALPAYLVKKIKPDNDGSLHPVLSVDLEGRLTLSRLLSAMEEHLAPAAVLKADIELIGDSNIGTVILQMNGLPENQAQAKHFLEQNSIKHQLLGYA